MKLSYKLAGVDIKKADEFIGNISYLVKKTFDKSVLHGIGNFGAFYKLDFKKFKNPVLVSSIDGVGTKIKLAILAKKFDTIGEDLVNHCVNDIAVCGATPLFFLDYYATGKLDPKIATEIIKGLIRGCYNNKVSLIGGETAEMPGIYLKDDFDLAGAIVGIAEKNKILNKKNVKKGDLLIGIASNGLHTNGYSLVRKIFDSKQKLFRRYASLESRLIEELLKVHKSYLQIIQKSINRFKINSISHITGGGILGNTKRVVPNNLSIKIDWKSWQVPEIFRIIQKEGNVSDADMRRTFNLGIGIIFIISKNILDKYTSFLKTEMQDYFIIGEIK
ncbi:MAG: phosphoribosylformylglycinamidine cyclo-ligase [Ignavibacteria bacterium]|nr:phosphoribosylformylglycinamidine cyclo-ligase [Ignavibacteria bacterium]